MKKGVFVLILILVVLVMIAAYIKRRRENAEAEKLAAILAQDSIKELPVKKPVTVHKQSPAKKHPAEVKKEIIPARDVLAYNENGLNGKIIFASDSTDVYNMDSEKAFVAKRDQQLGTVAQVHKTPAGLFAVNFIGKGGIKYYVTSNHVYILA